MRYDVDSVSSREPLIFHIPELAKLESFKNYPGTHGKELNADWVAKYVVLLYSEDSILNKRPMPPLKERKEQAATIAGFVKKSENWNKNIQNKLFNLESDYVVSMVFEFLIHQKNYIWTSICATEQTIDEYLKIAFTQIKKEDEGYNLMDAKRKKELMDLNKELIVDLDSYYKEFFKGHEEDASKLRRKRTRIEDLAKEPDEC